LLYFINNIWKKTKLKPITKAKHFAKTFANHPQTIFRQYSSILLQKDRYGASANYPSMRSISTQEYPDLNDIPLWCDDDDYDSSGGETRGAIKVVERDRDKWFNTLFSPVFDHLAVRRMWMEAMDEDFSVHWEKGLWGGLHQVTEMFINRIVTDALVLGKKEGTLDVLRSDLIVRVLKELGFEKVQRIQGFAPEDGELRYTLGRLRPFELEEMEEDHLQVLLPLGECQEMLMEPKLHLSTIKSQFYFARKLLSVIELHHILSSNVDQKRKSKKKIHRKS